MVPLLLSLLCAAPAPVKVVSTGIEGVGVDRKLLALLGERVAHRVGDSGAATVVTPGDMAAVLGVERQRELLGCAGDSQGCLAELAGALGVRFILSGDVAKLGQRLSATLKLLDATTGRALFAKETRARGEEALAEQLEQLADEVVVVLRAAQPVVVATDAPRAEPVVEASTPPVAVVAPPSTHWAPAVPVVGGVVVGVVGAVLLGKALGQLGELDALSGGAVTPESLSRGAVLRDEGKRNTLLGEALLGAGAVAIAGGLAWWLTPRGAPSVALAPLPGGAVLAVGGAVP